MHFKHPLYPRYVAYLIVSEVEEKKLFIEDLLLSKEYLDMSSHSKAFTRNLVSSFFRYKLKVSSVVSQLTNNNTEINIIRLLELAAVEIIFLKTPNYAVVNSYVELTKYFKWFKFTGLVNATLKKLCDNYEKLLNNYTPKNNWIINDLISEYGEDLALKIVDGFESRPKLDIVFQNYEEFNRYNASDINLGTSILPLHLRLNDNVEIKNLFGTDEGKFWVQNLSSMIALNLLKNYVEDKYVADLCAAPGGKSLYLSTMKPRLIAAFDISQKRLKIMQSNIDKLKLSGKIIVSKFNVLKLDNISEFDTLVLDVPCLGTGTIGKHPEILQVKTKKQLEDLIILQKKLLNHVAKNMKEGAILLYSNCSLQKSEGEYLINEFLKQNPNFSLIKVLPKEVFCRSEMITEEGYLRILPQFLKEDGGMEGFFAARLIKKSSK